MQCIRTIQSQRILNTHVNFTNEFKIELEDGSVGIGSSPTGETTSIYEGKPIEISPQNIVDTIQSEKMTGVPVNQNRFDAYLASKVDQFGHNNVFALSVAFYDASNSNGQLKKANEREKKGKGGWPTLFINLLNGGKYAYTNPVVSDFHEYLIVAKSGNLPEIVGEHQIVQEKIKAELNRKKKHFAGNRIVHKIGMPSNRRCLDFISDILVKTGLEGKYDLMIDAAGSTLWDGNQYRFSVTGKKKKTGEALCRYWLDILKNYNLRYLEDPFHEKDFENWKNLSDGQGTCLIIGDDIHSGDDKRISQLFSEGLMDGLILKPDQAGTVSKTVAAIHTANRFEKPIIMSHRSISTESVILPALVHAYGIQGVKFGPMQTDYSSIIKINELIRQFG